MGGATVAGKAGFSGTVVGGGWPTDCGGVCAGALACPNESTPTTPGRWPLTGASGASADGGGCANAGSGASAGEGGVACAGGVAGTASKAAAGGVAGAGGVAAAGSARGAASGVRDVGIAGGMAVTGRAVEVALLGWGALGCAANGGVAVEGMGMADLAAAAGGCDDASCEVMTRALPGGTATGVASVEGTSATVRLTAAARLRAVTACTLFGLNVGGSVAFLTWSAADVDSSGPVEVGSAEMESGESSCARAAGEAKTAPAKTALKKIAG